MAWARPSGCLPLAQSSLAEKMLAKGEFDDPRLVLLMGIDILQVDIFFDHQDWQGA